MNRFLISLVLLTVLAIATAKEKNDPSKNQFKQMGSEFATPNAYDKPSTGLNILQETITAGPDSFTFKVNDGTIDSTRISKIEKTYDSYGNLNSEASYSWDLYVNDWIGLSKDEYTFDSNGNQI